MAVVHIEIDHQLKQEASEVLAELGMNLSMGIEIFLKEVVNKKELPFQLNICSDPKKLDFYGVEKSTPFFMQ